MQAGFQIKANGGVCPEPHTLYVQEHHKVENYAVSGLRVQWKITARPALAL